MGMSLQTWRSVSNLVWVLASLGLAIVQWRLLAQIWQDVHQAMPVAGAYACWLIGSLCGQQVRGGVREWNLGLVTLAGVWMTTSWLGMTWHLPALPPLLTRLFPQCALALLLGAFGTAWIGQSRPSWPPLREGVVHGVGLMAALVGTTVAWGLPAVAAPCGCGLLVPLLFLDRLPQPPGVILSQRQARQPREQVPLDHRGLGPNWVARYLAWRGQAGLTLLASGFAVPLGAVFGAVLVPFAASHSPSTLLLLLVSQVVACLLCATLVWWRRDLAGERERLLSPRKIPLAQTIALIALLLGAGSLVLLGAPALQSPWQLALCLGGYTLGLAVWGRLLPRLRPRLATQVQAQRSPTPWRSPPDEAQLGLWYALDTQAYQRVGRMETACIILLLPLAGGCVDRWGFDLVLMVSSGLLLLVGSAGGIPLLVSRGRDTQPRVQALLAEAACLPWPPAESSPAAPLPQGVEDTRASASCSKLEET